MRSSIATLAAFASTALAHYNFEALIVNGAITEPYQYVRQSSNQNSPIEDVTSPNIVCNAGGNDAAVRARTLTHDVAPGDEVGFTVNSEIGHPGPLAVYLSKAPGDASEYTGDGDWFKVYSLTYTEITEAGIQWANYAGNTGIKTFTFNLPETLAAGQYLLRVEHIGLHGAGSPGGAQFYISCAQINVTGAGSGTPSPLVKFPGAYDGTESGVLINIYYPAPTSYTAPGPAVWPNACDDHTANLNGEASDGDCTGSEGAAPAPAPVPSPVSPAPTPSSTVPAAAATSTAAPAPAETDAYPVPPAATTAPVVVPTPTPDVCAARKAKRAAKRAAKLALKKSKRSLA